MKQQAERMDKLKEIVSQQTVRAAYLENFSRNQQGDLEFLKKETTRLTEGKTKILFYIICLFVNYIDVTHHGNNA